jgi:biotin operon repressor
LSADTSLNAALQALMTSEADHVARLAEVREVIAGLRKVLGVTEAGAPRPVAKARITKDPDPELRRSKVDKAKEKIRAALARGPMSPGELAEKLGMERPALRYQVKQLEADGVVVSTGTTAGRRIALVGRPTKEAP